MEFFSKNMELTELRKSLKSEAFEYCYLVNLLIYTHFILTSYEFH